MKVIVKQHTGVIVAFDMSNDDFGKMSVVNEGDAHITLVYLGDAEALPKDYVLQSVQNFAAAHAPISGKFSGFGVFPANAENDNKAPVVAFYDSPELPAFRQALMRSLVPYSERQTHGYIPHMTLIYTDKDSVYVPTENQTYTKTFQELSVFWGDEHFSYKLAGNLVEKEFPIKDAAKGALIGLRTSMFNDHMATLSEQVYTGKISIGAWEEAMKVAIKELHSAVAVIGKGGWSEMTQSDWGRVGAITKAQYRYLHGFAEKLASDMDTISLKAIQARASMYGNASHYTASVMQAGDLAGGTRRKPTAFAGLPFMPGDGSTECLTNCRCYWALKIIDRTKDIQLVQATWHLRPAEHCDTCYERKGFVAMLKVPIDVIVPETIGMFNYGS